MAERGGRPEIVVRALDGESRIAFQGIEALAGRVDPSRTVILADPVARRYIPGEFAGDRVVELPRGEAAKCLSALEAVYGRFLELDVGRDWTVVGVGGGSVSDLAGYAASTWMRGIDFGFVPTTVLSMVDASVGGKNGIDFHGYKNLIGTFRLPRFVLVDARTLASLPSRDVAAGLAEAVKHAVIEGEAHLAALEKAVPPGGTEQGYRAPEDPNDLMDVLRLSVELKSRIVESDPRESGDRRKLNLGHTIGHAVEAVMALPHGECVAVGLALALRLAEARCGAVSGADRVIALLGRLGLPRTLDQAFEASERSVPDFREAVAQALSKDKKRVSGDVLFALPDAVGDVRIVPIPLNELKDFVREAP